MSRLMVALTVLAVLLGGASALAEDSAQQQVKAACKADYRRFCFGTMPGSGRILACLGKHVAELSPLCGQVVGIAQLCAEDRKTHCASASPGKGELKSCLEANRAKLSEGCARVLPASAPAPK